MKCDGCFYNVNNYCEKYGEKCSDKRATIGMCKEIRHNLCDKILTILTIFVFIFYLIDNLL